MVHCPTSKADLARLIEGTPLGAKVKIIKVWSVSGHLLFSMSGTIVADRIGPSISCGSSAGR